MDLHRCLKTFVTVVEQQGFAAAARKLYRSAPQISKEIQWLEDYFSVQLLTRTTRKLNLTESGQQCYDHAKQWLEDWHYFRETLKTQEEKIAGTLRVSTSIGFAESCLLAPMSEFLLAYPDIRLEVNFTNSFVDLINDQYDVGVRTQHPENSAYHTEHLTSANRSVYASPSYLSTYGEPKTPTDLTEHRCLMHSAIANPSRWYFNNNIMVPIKPVYQCNSIDSLIHAATAGVGCAYFSEFHIREHLRQGNLVELLADYRVDPIPLFICRPKRTPVPKRVSMFIDYLKNAVKNDTPTPPAD